MAKEKNKKVEEQVGGGNVVGASVGYRGGPGFEPLASIQNNNNHNNNNNEEDKSREKNKADELYCSVDERMMYVLHQQLAL